VNPLSELERRVVGRIDETQLVSDLVELVAIPSVDGSPGERDAQQWCADRLAGIGLSVETWDIDVNELRALPDFPGMEVERTDALGCVATLGRADADPALAFCGHTDVVPPGDLELWPSHDPFSVQIDASGLASGRGACDMKAGVVASIAAISAIVESGVTLSRPLAMHCVSAEEDGGLGAYATLRRGHRADACIIAEPTAGDVIPANAGALTFRIEVSGRATHGSTRTRGVSAIERFERVHQALRRLEERRNRDAPELFAHLELAWPLSVGVVSAGSWASTVPDRLVAEGRFGVHVGETLTEAIAEFEAAVSDISAADPWLSEHPVAVSWPGGRFAPGSLPDGHPLLDEVIRAVTDVVGREPAVVGAPYGSDLRHYAAAGVATVQYGPGDVRFAHAVDEHVDLSDVISCARVYTVLALRSCGVTPPLT
jgi:acetylornithine deacetylase